MNYCPKCGEKVQERDIFCKRCGTRLESGETALMERKKAKNISKDCAFCDGKGKIPLTMSALDRAMHRTVNCEVCGGVGKTFFPEEPQLCKACDGTGKHWEGVTVRRFSPCTACGGKGWQARAI